MSAHLAAVQLDRRYKEVVLGCGYRADLLVDECILVEEGHAHQGWNPAHDLAETIITKPTKIFSSRSLRSSRFNFLCGY